MGKGELLGSHIIATPKSLPVKLDRHRETLQERFFKVTRDCEAYQARLRDDQLGSKAHKKAEQALEASTSELEDLQKATNAFIAVQDLYKSSEAAKLGESWIAGVQKR